MLEEYEGLVSKVYRQLMALPPTATVTLDMLKADNGLSMIDLIQLSPFAINKKIEASVLGKAATAAEYITLIRFYRNSFLVRAQYRDYVNYYQEMFPFALLSMLFAKEQLTGTLGAAGQSGTIYVSALRPVTVYAPTKTAVETWATTVSTAGWNTGVFNINNQFTSTTPALNLYKNTVEVIFGLADFGVPPKIFEVQLINEAGIKGGVISYPVINEGGNLGFINFPEVQYLGVQDSLTIDINYLSTGNAVPTLLGIEYNTAVRYNAE